MAKVFVRVNVGLLEDSRYDALSWEAKAAWHTLNMAQGAQPQERFRNVPEHPVLILRKNGCPNPESAVAEMVALGWFDQDALGWTIHNYSVYQVPSRAQEMREKRARAGAFANVQTEKEKEKETELVQESTTNEDDEFERPVLGAREFNGPHPGCARSDFHVHVPR